MKRFATTPLTTFSKKSRVDECRKRLPNELIYEMVFLLSTIDCVKLYSIRPRKAKSPFWTYVCAKVDKVKGWDEDNEIYVKCATGYKKEGLKLVSDKDCPLFDHLYADLKGVHAVGPTSTGYFYFEVTIHFLSYYSYIEVGMRKSDKEKFLVDTGGMIVSDSLAMRFMTATDFAFKNGATVGVGIDLTTKTPFFMLGDAKLSLHTLDYASTKMVPWISLWRDTFPHFGPTDPKRWSEQDEISVNFGGSPFKYDFL